MYHESWCVKWVLRQGCIKLGLVRTDAGVREVFPFHSGDQSNPAGLILENERGTHPCRLDLKSLVQPCKNSRWNHGFR